MQLKQPQYIFNLLASALQGFFVQLEGIVDFFSFSISTQKMDKFLAKEDQKIVRQ